MSATRSTFPGLGFEFDATEVRHDDDGIAGVFLHPVEGGSHWIADYPTDDEARKAGRNFAGFHSVAFNDFL